MRAIDYLIEQLEGVVNELSEEIRDCDSIVPRAYKQGKKDAYSFVLNALVEGITEERKEIEKEMRG